jgi:hypothetical protein
MLKESVLPVGVTLKALLIWFGILVLAIVNGGIRDAILIPVLGNVSGLVLSGILLSAIIFTVSYLSLSWIGREPAYSYIAIGVGWLCLTLVFEFTFGLFVQDKPLSELLFAYTFKDGNIWPIVLLVIVASPYLAAKTRGWV